MSNLIYDGDIKVYDKKANGETLLIGKGDRKGEPYYKVSFQVGGEWVNLMDFEGVTKGQGGRYHVEYFRKFKQNGEPDDYNGKPQYGIIDLFSLGGTPTQQTTAAPSTSTAKGNDYNAGLGAFQTALNCATQLQVAIIGAEGIPSPDFDIVAAILNTAEEFHGYLTTGKTNLLDQMLGKAKDTLGAAIDNTPADADDKPDPTGDEENFPF